MVAPATISELRIGRPEVAVFEERAIVIEHQRARHEHRRGEQTVFGRQGGHHRPVEREQDRRHEQARHEGPSPRPHPDRSRNALPPNARIAASAKPNATAKMMIDSADP